MKISFATVRKSVLLVFAAALAIGSAGCSARNTALPSKIGQSTTYCPQTANKHAMTLSCTSGGVVITDYPYYDPNRNMQNNPDVYAADPSTDLYISNLTLTDGSILPDDYVLNAHRPPNADYIDASVVNLATGAIIATNTFYASNVSASAVRSAKGARKSKGVASFLWNQLISWGVSKALDAVAAQFTNGPTWIRPIANPPAGTIWIPTLISSHTGIPSGWREFTDAERGMWYYQTPDQPVSVPPNPDCSKSATGMCVLVYSV